MSSMCLHANDQGTIHDITITDEIHRVTRQVDY